MTDKILIPTPDAIVGPVLEKMYEVRPTTFQHLNLRSGVYWHPVAGFRAQAAKALGRLADRAAARRLNSATGQDLRDYVASEFLFDVPELGKTYAEGTVTLSRADLTAPLTGGDYPKGTRVSRSSQIVSGVVLPPASYETLVDVHVDDGSTADVVLPIRATLPGSSSSYRAAVGIDVPVSTLVSVSNPNLVPNMTVTDFQVGGGSDEGDDPFIRAIAKTAARGQYGPTADASKLAAITSLGVRKFLVYDRVDIGAQRILVADSAWCSSDRWAAIVQGGIYDSDLVGFGCKMSVGSVFNYGISATAQVALRDANYLADTSDIDDAIRKATRSYFDDRPDWNLWNKDALRSAIAVSHPKILSCLSVTVKSLGAGTPEVSEILTPDYTTTQYHFLLASNAMTTSYVGPA